ncbi:MAG: hypothetical protein WBV70_05095 [Candidatus Bathyarchaeia archaeon]
MKQIGEQNNGHRVLFDCSAIEAAAGYLRNRTDENLERLISMQGSRLAYSHYMWSSFGSKLTIRVLEEKPGTDHLEHAAWNRH